MDLATPANSTLTTFASPAAAGFTAALLRHAHCVPQAGTTQTLDSLGDRLMFRLAYRNFGDHESVVGNTPSRRRRRRHPLVRTARRDQRARDGLPGEHLPARHDLALDGQRGDGQERQHGPRLQRLERTIFPQLR